MFLFEPEHDYGNVEYKAHMNRLVGVKRHRYISQIKYRIMEGEGVAYYVIGVRDDGKVIGLPRSNVERSLQTFMKLISISMDSCLPFQRSCPVSILVC